MDGPCPRAAMRRHRKVVVVLGVSIALALSGLGIESASASTKSRFAVSLNSDRSSAARLDGSTVSGKIYIFVRNSKNLDKVDFYVDSPEWRKRPPVRTDKKAPFDFAGTAADGTARPYNTARLADGTHTMRVVLTWTDGMTSTRRGRFKVHNGGVKPTPTPTPTPTTTTAPPTTPASGQTSAPTQTTRSTSTTTSTRTTVSASATPKPRGPSGSWNLVFQDEFNGSTLDSQNWIAQDPRVMNNVITRAKNASVSGGELKLQLNKESDGRITGAVVTTQREWGGPTNSYLLPVGSYVEARIFFPGSGTEDIYNWPAWWTYAEPWSESGEHDIAEGLGGDMTSNYHYTANGADVPDNKSIAGVWGNAFHTYGVYRKASSADIYFDGELVRSYATHDTGVPQALLFNVGASHSRAAVTGAAGQVKVDYVRAWRPAR